MGFMAGFGSAFSQSFQADQDRIAQKDEDTFRMQYQDYISQRDYRQKLDLENKKNLRMARSIVAGTTGQPPEAVQWAYEQLSGGASPEYVQKYLNDNQATVTPNTTTKPGDGATANDAQPADPRDNLSTAASSSVDSQMTASGMKAPASGGIFGNIKQGMHDIFSGEGKAARTNDRSTQRIAGATGVDPQQVKDTLSGKNMPGDPLDGMPNTQIKFAPKGATFQQLQAAANNYNDATALKVWTDQNGTPEQKMYADNLYNQFKQQKSNEIRQNAFALDPSKAPQRGMVRNPNGLGYNGKFVQADYSDGDPLHPKWIDDQGQEVDPKLVQPVGQNQEADMKAVAEEASEDMKPYEQAKTDQKAFIRTANDYITLLKDSKGKYDAKAMDITGDVSQFVDRWRRAAVNIADLVMPQGEVPDASSAVAELDKAEAKVRNELASGRLIDANSQNALKASLIDIQGTKLAYQMAAQANGSTKGISNADFQHFKDVVSGNGNPVTAAKALQMSIKQGSGNLGDMEKNIKTGRGKASYYKGKYPGAPNGFDMGQSFEDESAQDPEIAAALKNINADAGEETNPGQQINTSENMPEWATKAQQPIVGLDGQEVAPGMWKYMSPALQDAIKKKNGL
jgi:hypothetical protein